jgi:hypothetical protein
MISTIDDELKDVEPPPWTPTVDVYIRANFTKIMDIDTVNQRFQAEAIVESIWAVPNLKMGDKIDDKTIWKPDIYIDYGVKDVGEEVVYKVVPGPNNSEYSICELRKVRGVFWENLEVIRSELDRNALSWSQSIPLVKS